MPLSQACSTFLDTTCPRLLRSRARVPATSTRGLASCNSSPRWQRRLCRKASRQPRQPYRAFAAGASGRCRRKLLAKRLAGQGSAPASSQAPERMDSGESLPEPAEAPFDREDRIETRGRGLRHLPTSQRLQYQPVCPRAGCPVPRRRLLSSQGDRSHRPRNCCAA